jgi:predicted amino acid-binding ACT domain protein
VNAALFVAVERGVISLELKELLLTQIEANYVSHSKRYKQKKWETNNAFKGYVARYQDEEIYNLIDDPKGIVIDVYHAILLTGVEREIISQEDFDDYFKQATLIIRSDSEVERDELYDLFEDTKPLIGFETEEALEAEAEKYWICPSCNETVEIEMGVCWNCQEKIPEVIEHPEKELIIKEIRVRQHFSPVKSGFLAIGIGLFVILIDFAGRHTHYYRLVVSGIIVLAGVFLVITGLFSKSKGKN